VPITTAAPEGYELDEVLSSGEWFPTTRSLLHAYLYCVLDLGSGIPSKSPEPQVMYSRVVIPAKRSRSTRIEARLATSVGYSRFFAGQRPTTYLAIS
jgi:hypothetical protein